MESKKYLDDISEIKNMMSRSSRFISLSGLSGILAGIYATTGATLAYIYLAPADGEYVTLHSWNFKLMVAILIAVAALSIITAFLITSKKAKHNNEKNLG